MLEDLSLAIRPSPTTYLLAENFRAMSTQTSSPAEKVGVIRYV